MRVYSMLIIIIIILVTIIILIFICLFIYVCVYIYIYMFFLGGGWIMGLLMIQATIFFNIGAGFYLATAWGIRAGPLIY